MATLTTDQVAATYPVVGSGHANTLKAVTGTYTLTAALALNDVIQMVKVPSGAKIVDVLLVTPDLDTNATPTITLDVGYGDDADYFIDGSNVGQAGGVARASAVTAKPLTMSAEDTIDITVSAAPATGAASGTIALTVFYTVG